MKNNKSLGQHWLKNRAILDEIADLAASANPSRQSGMATGFCLLRDTKRAAEPTARNERPVYLVGVRVKNELARSSEATPKILSKAKFTGAREGVSNGDESQVPLCLEIGPGLGTLTASLLKRFEKVIAIEFDAQLAKNLPKSFPGKNLEVIHADVLQTDFAQLANGQTYAVAGNIPYYITSPILQHFLAATPKAQRGVFLIQKEVAERVAAEKSQTLLSLTVQNLADVALGPVVPAAEFTPPPKVDSQVLILTPRQEPQVDPAILDFAKIGFSSPRKKLSANLAGVAGRSKIAWEEILIQHDLSPNARPGDLCLQDWANIAPIS